MKKYVALFGVLTVIMCTNTFADITVDMKMLNGDHADIGSVTATDTKYGLLLTPNFTKLPPGLHGFHVHEKPSCDNNGMAAEGHLDPNKSNLHLGPYNNKGHLGDMPVLYVDADGNANTPILAPRLSIAKIKNRAIMIHAGGDNYSDTPPMGGGGARLACGIAKKS